MVKHRKSFGFTLVELLVVIAVVGILAAVILVAINPVAQMQKARNAQRKSDLRTMANAVERYRASTGSYPSTGGAIYGPIGSPWYYTDYGWDFIPNVIASGDLKVTPKDPNTGKPNNYPSESDCYNDTWVSQWGDGNYGNNYLYKSDGIDYKLLAMCSPEGNVFSSSDPFYDPHRPTWAWQISSSDISRDW